MRSRSSSADRRRLLCQAAVAATLLAASAAISAPTFAAAGSDARMAEGRALFIGGASPPCAICHTLKDAGATGTVGPVLDELRPDEERVASAVRAGIGIMPSFAASLSEAQIRAVAHYVAAASGGAH